MELTESRDRIEEILRSTRNAYEAADATVSELVVSEPRQCTDDLNRPTGQHHVGYTMTAQFPGSTAARDGLDATEPVWSSLGLAAERSSFGSLAELAGTDGPRELLVVHSEGSDTLEVSAGTGCGSL